MTTSVFIDTKSCSKIPMKWLSTVQYIKYKIRYSRKCTGLREFILSGYHTFNISTQNEKFDFHIPFKLWNCTNATKLSSFYRTELLIVILNFQSFDFHINKPVYFFNFLFTFFFNPIPKSPNVFQKELNHSFLSYNKFTLVDI